MTYFFTADEHYGHANIIKYCNRPFKNVKEMNQVLIERHNEIVEEGDTVIHAGDFTFRNPGLYVDQLSGHHVFLRGSHDKWMDKSYHEIWEKTIEGQKIVVCHYPMRTWAASHYNSWQLHGHSHGQLKSQGKQLDIGVDSHDFYPVAFPRVKMLMENKEDNINLVRKEDEKSKN